MTDDKPYKLTLIERKLYVYAHVKADTVTRETSSMYLTEIANACRKSGKNRLMIYRDIPEMLSPDSIRDVGGDFARMIGDIRTAAVNPYLTEIELERSVKNLPKKGGFRVFTNFKEAEVWLLAESSARENAQKIANF